MAFNGNGWHSGDTNINWNPEPSDVTWTVMVQSWFLNLYKCIHVNILYCIHNYTYIYIVYAVYINILYMQTVLMHLVQSSKHLPTPFICFIPNPWVRSQNWFQIFSGTGLKPWPCLFSGPDDRKTNHIWPQRCCSNWGGKAARCQVMENGRISTR